MTYKHLLLPALAACMPMHALERDTLTLNEFTLTSYGKSAIALRPLDVSVISSETIDESAESSLLPILSNQISGLFVSERGFEGYGVSTGAAGIVNIRGIGQGNKVLFLIDGQPHRASIYGHALPDVYATNGVARVDVVKGPASLIYGSNAMGGAINIITRRADKDGTYGNASAMFGSFATQKFSLSTGTRKGKWQTNAAAQLSRSNGNRAGSDMWQANEFAQVQYTHNSHFEYGANTEMTQTMSNFPGTEQSPLVDMYTRIDRYTAALYARNHHSVADGGVRAFFNYGKHKISDGHAPDAVPVDTLFRSTDYEVGVMLHQTLRPWRGGDLSVGANFQHWGGHVTKGIEQSESEVGGFALMQQAVWGELLTVNGGVRLQHGTAYGNVWVPQAGFTLRPVSDGHLRFSFGKGFRSPNLRELYIGVAANPHLRAEYLYNYEVELRKQLFDKRLDICASLFFIDAKNMIQTAIIDGRARNVNTGAFRNKGFEVETRMNVTKQICLSMNYSYLHTSSSDLLYAPKNMLNAEAVYRPGAFAVTVQSHTVWRLNSGAPTHENYSLLNVRLAYEARITPIIKLDNITNRHYEIIYGCPMPGTTIMGGVQIKI
jgi:iron complex outermembrane receptor protein